MSDSMTKSQLLCLATIGVVLVPQYRATPTNCPVVTCKRGQQYQKPCGPCVPCPEGFYMPDEVKSDRGIDCIPFKECGEGAVRNCSLNGRLCQADEAQHCVCDLDSNNYGIYPNCIHKTCSGGTKLDISGACTPIVSPPSSSPDTSPPSSPVPGPRGHRTDSTGAITKSDPIHESTPATPEGTTKAETPCICPTPEIREAENKWTMLFIGITAGAVGMAVLVLVTMCIVAYIYVSKREGQRENGRHPEQRSFPSLLFNQYHTSNSTSHQVINGDQGQPMLGQMPTEGEDPTPVADDMEFTPLPQCPSLSHSEEEAPDTHPDDVN